MGKKVEEKRICSVIAARLDLGGGGFRQALGDDAG
jgi:hypothetical protein